MVLHSFLWRHAGNDVKVTGEFDDWSARTSMQRTEDGHFVKVIDLPANSKVYYKFVVDGHWCVDGEALKEGEGAHENNYILTGAALDANKAPKDESSSDLPALGHGAAYVNATAPVTEKSLGGAVPDISEPAPVSASTQVSNDYKCEIQTNQGPTKEVQTNTTGLIGVGGSANDAAPTSTSQANNVAQKHYDDSGASPSDPIAVRSARENPIAHAYSDLVSQLPTGEEFKHEFEHVAGVAGGVLAAGVAAGAAMFGLSNRQSHTEKAPITGATVTDSKLESTIPTTSSTVRPAESTAAKSVHVSETPKSPQTGSLEQAAVAAATSAATNAYNASGLSGLSGVGAPLSSLSKDGNLGFTGIGTAVNEKTGVVGTSKIVQGIDDASVTEDTQTAKLASATAGSLLQNHENGAKVERINDHAVLAEVGIGGAAIGTAVVTDRTVSSTKGLNIPAQAAEHLKTEPEVPSIPSVKGTSAATSTTLAAASTEVQENEGLAPALEHNTVVQSAAVVTTSGPVDLGPTSVKQTIVDEPVTVIPSETAQVLPTTVTSQTSTKDVSKVAAAAPAGVVDTDSSRPTTAATKASEATATSYETAKTSAPASSQQARSPSKAAAEAASKNSTMRQTLRPEPTAEAAASTTGDAASKKKKTPFLRRMKSLFAGSKN